MVMPPELYPDMYPRSIRYMWKDPELLIVTKVNQCSEKLIELYYAVESEV
jgi:hypothetical protein